jgi:hypothetical protein
MDMPRSSARRMILSSAGQQPAVDDVERHHHARMADVAQVVDRDAADVHAHMARLDRPKLFQTAGESVVDAQGHGTGDGRRQGDGAGQ